MPDTPERDIARDTEEKMGDTEEKMDGAEGSDDQTRLETLEEVQRTLESELDEGAETPPA